LLPKVLKIQKSRQQRNTQIAEAHNTHTLKEIADCAGIHYTTIGKAVAGNKKK
jgi:hypothetical protein